MIARHRLAASAVGALLVFGAAAILAWSTVTTSTARLSASTGGQGFFAAGTVELDQPESVVALLFDADGLYPGQTLSSCVIIGYEGSIPADVRLHARSTGGTGLEQFIELRLWARVTTTGACPEDTATQDAADPDDVATQDAADDTAVTEPATLNSRRTGSQVFDGLLGELWARHPDFATGLPLIVGAEDGDRIVLSAEAVLAEDDDAQGLTSEFAVIVEARP